MENLFAKKFSNLSLKPINEVAEEIGIEPYVLRFWETKFPQISPTKGRGNRRLYNHENIETIKLIKDLLYGHGYTIEGAKKYLTGNNNSEIIANNNHSDKLDMKSILDELKQLKLDLDSLQNSN
ncbi:MAG: MerR family transcriptional regulator [Rickettsiales bacterium]|nr:MerR family transcriptional regulator [Rickettsiales bacterium]